MAQLLCGRALQGIGGGGIISAAYVAIARGYPDALRARMMALNSSVWILPAVLGPAISGKVTEVVGWRWVFVGVVPFLFVCAALVLRPLARYDLRLPLPSTLRVRAAAQLAVGAALLIAAPSLRSRGLLVVLALLVVGLALGVRGFRAVLPRGTLFAARGLPAGLAVRGLLGFSFFGTEAFIPLAASRLRGATPTEAGLALSAGAIGWVTSSWIGERIEARVRATGRVARVRLGFIGLAAGIALVGAALLSPLPLWIIPLGWALSGAGIGLAFTTNGLICIAAAPAGEEGNVAGQLQLVEALGTSAGAGLGGAALAALERAGWSLGEAQLAMFSITFGAAVVGALIAPRLATPEG